MWQQRSAISCNVALVLTCRPTSACGMASFRHPRHHRVPGRWMDPTHLAARRGSARPGRLSSSLGATSLQAEVERFTTSDTPPSSGHAARPAPFHAHYRTLRCLARSPLRPDTHSLQGSTNRPPASTGPNSTAAQASCAFSPDAVGALAPGPAVRTPPYDPRPQLPRDRCAPRCFADPCSAAIRSTTAPQS